MIVHALKVCSSYFVYISCCFFSFLGVLNLEFFSVKRVSGLCIL